MTPDKTICRFFLTSIIQAMLLATCFAASGENNYVTVLQHTRRYRRRLR